MCWFCVAPETDVPEASERASSYRVRSAQTGWLAKHSDPDPDEPLGALIEGADAPERPIARNPNGPSGNLEN